MVITYPEKEAAQERGGPGPGQSGVCCVSQDSGDLGPGVWSPAGVAAWMEVDQLFHLGSFLVYQM